MDITQFDAWKIAARAYWVDAIDLSGYDNTVFLTQVLDSQLAALQNELDRYQDLLVGQGEDSTFKIFLLHLMGYVSLRMNNLTPDEEEIGIPELIEGDDIRNLFQAYDFLLPEPDLLFTIESEVEPPENGRLVDTAEYTTLLATMSGMTITGLTEAIGEFMDAFRVAAFEKSLYMAYASPPVTQGLTKDIRSYIREDMHLLDLMESMGMSILGVNHHYYLPDGTREDV
jgi:hypothetical protein